MSDDKKKKKNDDKKAKPRVKPMGKTTRGKVPTNSPSQPVFSSRQPSSISPNSSSDGYIQDGRPTNITQPMMQMKIDPNSNPGPLATRALEQLDPRIANASSGHNLISLSSAPSMSSPRPFPHSSVAPNTTQQPRATISVLPTANRTAPDSSRGIVPPTSFPVPSSSPSPASSPPSRDVLDVSSVIDLPDQRPTAVIMASQSFVANTRTVGSAGNADNISLGSRVSRNVDESRVAADLIPMDDPQREQKLKCCRHYLRVRYLPISLMFLMDCYDFTLNLFRTS